MIHAAAFPVEADGFTFDAMAMCNGESYEAVLAEIGERLDEIAAQTPTLLPDHIDVTLEVID